MTVIKLDDIFNSAAHRRSSLAPDSMKPLSPQLFKEAWQAFNRYMRAMMSEGKSLHLSSFCTVCITLYDYEHSCRLAGCRPRDLGSWRPRWIPRSGNRFSI